MHQAPGGSGGGLKARHSFEVSLDSFSVGLESDSASHHAYAAQGLTYPDFFDARLTNFFTLLQFLTSNREIMAMNLLSKEQLRTGGGDGNSRSQFATCHGERDNFVECWLSREYYGRFVRL